MSGQSFKCTRPSWLACCNWAAPLLIFFRCAFLSRPSSYRKLRKCNSLLQHSTRTRLINIVQEYPISQTKIYRDRPLNIFCKTYLDSWGAPFKLEAKIYEVQSPQLNISALMKISTPQNTCLHSNELNLINFFFYNNWVIKIIVNLYLS